MTTLRVGRLAEEAVHYLQLCSPILYTYKTTLLASKSRHLNLVPILHVLQMWHSACIVSTCQEGKACHLDKLVQSHNRRQLSAGPLLVHGSLHRHAVATFGLAAAHQSPSPSAESR